MADYYLYLLDPNGHVARRIDLQGYESDDHARNVAAANPYKGAKELWQGVRVVEIYPVQRAEEP